MDTLPQEIIHIIFDLADTGSVRKFGNTSKFNNRIVNDYIITHRILFNLRCLSERRFYLNINNLWTYKTSDERDERLYESSRVRDYIEYAIKYYNLNNDYDLTENAEGGRFITQYEISGYIDQYYIIKPNNTSLTIDLYSRIGNNTMKPKFVYLYNGVIEVYDHNRTDMPTSIKYDYHGCMMWAHYANKKGLSDCYRFSWCTCSSHIPSRCNICILGGLYDDNDNPTLFYDIRSGPKGIITRAYTRSYIIKASIVN